MKLNWKTILKVAALGAGGAVVASPDVQQTLVAAVPPPWNILLGSAFGVAALYVRSPAKVDPPNETKP